MERSRPVGLRMMKRVINPLVGLILRSPLHRLLSGSLMLVSVTGKKTGRRFTFPVQYKREGDELIVIPGMPEKKRWWRNLIGGAPVDLQLSGVSVPAFGQVFDNNHVHQLRLCRTLPYVRIRFEMNDPETRRLATATANYGFPVCDQ